MMLMQLLLKSNRIGIVISVVCILLVTGYYVTHLIIYIAISMEY